MGGETMRRKKERSIVVQAVWKKKLVCDKTVPPHSFAVEKIYILNGTYPFAICPVHYELIKVKITMNK